MSRRGCEKYPLGESNDNILYFIHTRYHRKRREKNKNRVQISIFFFPLLVVIIKNIYIYKFINLIKIKSKNVHQTLTYRQQKIPQFLR